LATIDVSLLLRANPLPSRNLNRFLGHTENRPILGTHILNPGCRQAFDFFEFGHAAAGQGAGDFADVRARSKPSYSWGANPRRRELAGAALATA
jgi:hypothetical protein